MSESTIKIFVVEDDPWYGQLILRHLSLNPDYEVKLYTTGKELLAAMHLRPSIVCMDFGLPDFNGERLLKEIVKVSPGLPVIVISAQDEISVAVNLLKAGAHDYIIKDDFTKEHLWRSVLNIREKLALKKEVEVLKDEVGQKYAFEKSIKGQSPAMKSTFNLMEKASQSNINVSITGETGTGKELVAKAIHYNSARKQKPFVPVNMAAIPRELIESELFGHEKGSFTGALARKIGKFEEANGGTLFLDEIAELDLSLQSKLLRVLQEREVVRVGGHEQVKLDVRIIVATHKDLRQEVLNKTFREDLFYRVIGLPIELPPLRDRQNDVLVLAKFFLNEFTKENGVGPFTFSQSAKDKLMSHNYPGNVRELKAIIDLAAVMCSSPEIQPEDIQINTIHNQNLFSLEEKTLRQYTLDIISHYLNKYDHDVLKVADKLDIGKSTIYKMLQEKEISL